MTIKNQNPILYSKSRIEALIPFLEQSKTFLFSGWLVDIMESSRLLRYQVGTGQHQISIGREGHCRDN